MWWNLKIVSLEPQPNKNTKDEANKQKPNRITSAGTAADSDKMMKLTTSSHHIAKPPVVCTPFSSVFYNVSLCHPVEWLWWVGQGRLLDRLAFVLWVCAPDHVPDLQRWLVRVVLSLGLNGRMVKVFICVQQVVACKVILSVCKQKVFVYTVILSTCKQTLCVCKQIFVRWVLIL